MPLSTILHKVTTRFQVSVLLRGRGRIRQHSAHYDVVENIDEIYLGHTIVKEHTQIDNCHYIDVGSSFTKKLCIVKIQWISDVVGEFGGEKSLIDQKINTWIMYPSLYPVIF